MVTFSTVGFGREDLAAKPRVSESCFAQARVTNQMRKEGKQLLIFEVTAATVLNQIGCVHLEYLSHPTGTNADKDRQLCRRLGRSALALGLATMADIEAGEVTVDFADAIGREVTLELVKRQQGIQVSFLGIWAVDDPDAPKVN